MRNFFAKARRVLIIFSVSLILSGCTGGFLGESSGGGEGADEYKKSAIVKGFPSLPLYPKAKVVESYGFGDKYGAVFITDDNVEKVIEFYTQSLATLGWENNVVRTAATNYQFAVKNNESQGIIIVNLAADGKKTAITVAVEPRL